MSYGRPDRNFAGRVRINRVRLNNGGYDTGGCYWGIGSPLYMVIFEDCDGDEVWTDHFRVKSPDDRTSRALRADIKAQVQAKWPLVQFYR